MHNDGSHKYTLCQFSRSTEKELPNISKINLSVQKKLLIQKTAYVETLDFVFGKIGYRESVTKVFSMNQYRERVYLGGNRTQAVQAK